MPAADKPWDVDVVCATSRGRSGVAPRTYDNLLCACVYGVRASVLVPPNESYLHTYIHYTRTTAPACLPRSVPQSSRVSQISETRSRACATAAAARTSTHEVTTKVGKTRASSVSAHAHTESCLCAEILEYVTVSVRGRGANTR